MMVKELFKKIDELKEEFLDEGYVVGVRFEELERQEGDVITEVSRHNLDRDDERDFPEYGTEEYFNTPELDGVSAYDAESFERVITPSMFKDRFLNNDAKTAFLASKCYLIVSYDTANEDDALDDGEVVLVDPEVVKVLF